MKSSTTTTTKKATTTTTAEPTKKATKPPTKPATKPTTKAATKAATKPATKPTTKPASKAATKSTAEKSAAKTKKVVKALEALPLLLKKKANEIGNDAATPDLVLKRFYDSYELLPMRCRQEHPELGCRYGWYYEWRSGKCETLYACLNDYNDPKQNYFKTEMECASVCQQPYSYDGNVV